MYKAGEEVKCEFHLPSLFTGIETAHAAFHVRVEKHATDLGSVAADEVIHSLLLGQLADRWQHPKGITAKQDEILGVGPHTGYPGIGDVVNWVGRPGVLCHSTATQQTWLDTDIKSCCLSSSSSTYPFGPY